MENLFTDKNKNTSQLIRETFFTKSIEFIKGIFSWYFFQKETLKVKLKQKDTQIDDLKAQLNIVNHMYEEGRNLLKEQKRDLEEMLKMEREGANIPPLIQLGREKANISQWSKIKINKLKAKIERLTKAGIPTSPEGYYELGLTSYYNDEIEDAIKQWETVIELDKNNMSSHHNLGILYYTIGMYDEAISKLYIVVKNHPKDQSPHYCLDCV